MRLYELFSKKIIENASSGATGAGSIAVAPGTLGAGFTDDLSASIYPVIRRSELTYSKKKRKKSK